GGASGRGGGDRGGVREAAWSIAPASERHKKTHARGQKALCTYLPKICAHSRKAGNAWGINRLQEPVLKVQLHEVEWYSTAHDQPEVYDEIRHSDSIDVRDIGMLRRLCTGALSYFAMG